MLIQSPQKCPASRRRLAGAVQTRSSGFVVKIMSGPVAVVADNPLSGFGQKIEWYIPNQYNGGAAASQDRSKWQNYCAYFLRHA